MSGSHFLGSSATDRRFSIVQFPRLTWPAMLFTLPLFLLGVVVSTRVLGFPVAVGRVWPFLPYDAVPDSGTYARPVLAFVGGFLLTYPLGRLLDIVVRPLLPSPSAVPGLSSAAASVRERVPGDGPFALRWKPFGLWVVLWVLLGLFPPLFVAVLDGLVLAVDVVLFPWYLVVPPHPLVVGLLAAGLFLFTYPPVAACWWQYTESGYYQTVVRDDDNER